MQFSDMARLLNTYQLWLDDLFPKAKFMDGVSMIEKLGHKKRIQMMRREWIDEGKPKPPRDDDDDDFVIPNEDTQLDPPNNPNIPVRSIGSQEPQVRDDQSNGGAPTTQPIIANQEPDEDDLDALLAEEESATTTQNQKPSNAPPTKDHEPDEDELDALMAEDAQNDNAPKSLFGGPMSSTKNNAQRPPPDDFDDDEEALAGMDW